ncbi:uncharacterized protein LOC121397910 isoform X2 [Xenopus laevis]|uniref:Uncharacterized protein LOC121397905 isoform X2 n=1 Tax=Xenopus laevis TaxID=8355 RepID=A0A8J1LTH1_XENLA|nr:uncharacterized protein LOC121397905 isoform X2 [Xenopus laevis]XP_041432034.1 uncharacterized protein LOC121397910 isoform X2 [Xenopus laevis]
MSKSKEAAASSIILKYLNDQNRPYSTQDVFSNLQRDHGLGKTESQPCLYIFHLYRLCCIIWALVGCQAGCSRNILGAICETSWLFVISEGATGWISLAWGTGESPSPQTSPFIIVT